MTRTKTFSSSRAAFNFVEKLTDVVVVGVTSVPGSRFWTVRWIG